MIICTTIIIIEKLADITIHHVSKMFLMYQSFAWNLVTTRGNNVFTGHSLLKQAHYVYISAVLSNYISYMSLYDISKVFDYLYGVCA